MRKNLDENKCLRSFSRIGRVDYHDKTLQCSRNATIGIHLLGKIDYLTKYCGWHFIWNNSAGVNYHPTTTSENTNSARAAKKAKKEPKLTDKTKKKK